MQSELELISRIILGGTIGFEREKVDKPAGLRTHILVSLGSAQVTILSLYASLGSDPSRIARDVVAGIGFIGAGTLIQHPENVVGVTTTASLWVTTSIGMAIGISFYLAALVVTVTIFMTLRLG